MLHAICDFCGKDCGRSAVFLTLTPFQNFARQHGDITPYGYQGKPKGFTMCEACLKSHNLPNPYHDYVTQLSDRLAYSHPLDAYTQDDMDADLGRMSELANSPDLPQTGLANANREGGSEDVT